MLNLFFHICGKNDQLNKIKNILSMIFVKMSDKNKMLLLDKEDKDHCVFCGNNNEAIV